MTRWKVRKETGIFWDEGDELRYGIRWHVATPTGVSWGFYATHAEALAKADKEARTVEVELPRVSGRTHISAHNGHPSRYQLIPQSQGRYCAMTIRGPWGEAGIYSPQDLEPLALALLAHARKENR